MGRAGAVTDPGEGVERFHTPLITARALDMVPELQSLPPVSTAQGNSVVRPTGSSPPVAKTTTGASSATRKNRRRRLFFDDLQYRLLAINLGYFVAILVIFIVTLFAPLMSQLLDSESSMFAREAVAAQFLWLDQSIWVAVLLTFVGLGAHSVLVSHRIAGPLYQFRRLLRGVGDGDLTARATLRKKDYLRAEEATVNTMIAKLGARIRRIEQHADGIRASLDSGRSALETGSTKEALAHLGRVARRLDGVEVELRQFTTGPGAPPVLADQESEPR